MVYINVYISLLIYNIIKFIIYIIFSTIYKKKLIIKPYNINNINYKVDVWKWLKFFTWYKPYYSAHNTTQIIFKKKLRKSFLNKLGSNNSWFFVVVNLIFIVVFGFGKIYFEYAYILYKRCYNSLCTLHIEKTTTFKLQFTSFLILELKDLKQLNFEGVTIPDDL